MFLKLLYAPLLYPEMLWILIPLIIAIILTETYFRKYPREGLGHHSSLENSVFMIFVLFNLAYYLVNNPSAIKTYVVALFGIYAVTVIALDFYHKLPTKTFMKLSSKFIIGFKTYIFIVLVYSDILLKVTFFDLFSMVVSAGILFFALVLVSSIISYLEPKTYPEIESYLNTIEQEIKSSGKQKKKKK